MPLRRNPLFQHVERLARKMWKPALLVVLAAATAVGGAALANSPGRVRFEDRGNGVSFSYPAAWMPQLRNSWDIHYEGIVVALSTERLRKPCVLFYNPDGTL